MVNRPISVTGIDKISTFTMGFVLILLHPLCGAQPDQQPGGPGHYGHQDIGLPLWSVGIQVTKYKMMAFVVSAALAGMAGALYGLNFSTVTASKFKFDTSILVLVFVVLGGIGNIRGSVIAATVLTILPDLLRAFSDYRMLVYAIVLILVMLLTNSPILSNLVGRLYPRLHRRSREKGGEAA